MGLARHAGLPAVVVGDIDRGGVFAALYGTVALLERADRDLVAGFVVNKFRGDPVLLEPGLADLERRTGRRVYGVLPWDPGLWLDSEDALDLEGRRSGGDRVRRVAVVRLPRISNFTDVDALGLEPGLDVVFASGPRDLSDADLVVLPGTRATLADLEWLRSRGLDRAVVDLVAAHGDAEHLPGRQPEGLVRGEVRAHVQQVLRRAGVVPLDAAPGSPFDPAAHLAVDTEPGPSDQTGQVARQVRPGWTSDGAVVRPAEVIVWTTT
jgi:hypothetical protein